VAKLVTKALDRLNKIAGMASVVAIVSFFYVEVTKLKLERNPGGNTLADSVVAVWCTGPLLSATTLLTSFMVPSDGTIACLL
jgi:hypothetical protein